MEENKGIELYLNKTLHEEQIKFPMLDFEINADGDYQYAVKYYEQPNKIGIILLDFIQNDLKDVSFSIFRFYGFNTLLTDNERKELLALDSHDNKELANNLEKLYNKYKKDFETYKKQIIDILEYCIFNEDENLKDLTPLQRLVVFCNSNDIEKYSILKHNHFNKFLKLNKDMTKMSKKNIINTLKDKENNRYSFQEIYEIDNFYNLLFLEMYFILKEDIYLKKCKNCGKYFLTSNSAVIYCDNIFESNKTCREIGASKVFIKNLENDDAYNLYRKVYKKKQALAKSKGGSYEIKYNLFKNQGRDKKNAYKLKEITKEEFIKWLTKQ